MWSGAPELRDQGLHPLCKCSDEIWNRAAHGEGPPKPAMGVCGGVSSQAIITSGQGILEASPEEVGIGKP